jgi:hypothetical protein
VITIGDASRSFPASGAPSALRASSGITQRLQTKTDSQVHPLRIVAKDKGEGLTAHAFALIESRRAAIKGQSLRN